MQRRKGAEFERDLADIFTTMTGTKIQRVLGQARDGGHDLRIPPGTLSSLPILIEAKRRARLPATSWLEQVLFAAQKQFDHPVPMVVARGDREPPIVIMRLSDWFRLIGAPANQPIPATDPSQLDLPIYEEIDVHGSDAAP